MLASLCGAASPGRQDLPELPLHPSRGADQRLALSNGGMCSCAGCSACVCECYLTLCFSGNLSRGQEPWVRFSLLDDLYKD